MARHALSCKTVLLVETLLWFWLGSSSNQPTACTETNIKNKQWQMQHTMKRKEHLYALGHQFTPGAKYHRRASTVCCNCCLRCRKASAYHEDGRSASRNHLPNFGFHRLLQRHPRAKQVLQNGYTTSSKLRTHTSALHWSV